MFFPSPFESVTWETKLSKGKILAGQFILYNIIWAAFIFLAYLLFKYIKKHA
jgi:hypothetical protein